MLGWMISVIRQKNGCLSPAGLRTRQGDLLAVWQAEIGSLDWLNRLVQCGVALAVGGTGYPMRYTAVARHLIPSIEAGPPLARERWLHGEGDVLAGDRGA